MRKVTSQIPWLIAILLALAASVHAAPTKEALLIANGNYAHFPGLANPLPDAEKLSGVLKSLGFRVRIVRNGSREDMLDGIKEFENSVRGTQAIAFFHYGGHGVQVGGRNYLLPADADIPDERRVAIRAVELDEVMGALEAANAKANVVVIDACRNNPLPTVAGRDSLRGLSVVGTKPKNSIIIYAAEAGSVAVDGLFTPIFASALSSKGRTIEQIMKVVRTEVYEKSGRQQTPGEYNQLFEELVLSELEEENLSPANTFQTPDDSLITPEELKERALQGDADAQRTLELIEIALKIGDTHYADLKKRADQGDAESQLSLGRSYSGDGDWVEAVKWYRKAAEQGHAGSQYILGVVYDNGEGVPKDMVEAVKWYRKAAEQGHAAAHYNLGVAYDNGEGVPKDMVEAVKWYRKAAEQGHAAAHYNLGVAYSKGEGVPKDMIEAYAFFNLASLKIEKASETRDLLAELMTGDQIAAAQMRTKELQKKLGAN